MRMNQLCLFFPYFEQVAVHLWIFSQCCQAHPFLFHSQYFLYLLLDKKPPELDLTSLDLDLGDLSNNMLISWCDDFDFIKWTLICWVSFSFSDFYKLLDSLFCPVLYWAGWLPVLTASRGSRGDAEVEEAEFTGNEPAQGLGRHLGPWVEPDKRTEVKGWRLCINLILGK